MTLAAAFYSSGVPVLMGDFRCSPRGLEKKILRLHPNLVVGWSGSHVAARMVLKDIASALGAETPSHGGLAGLLTTYPQSDLGDQEVELVGWVGNPPEAFAWDSNTREFRRDPPLIVGSGTQAGERFLRRIPQRIPSETTAADPLASIPGALWVWSQLLVDEVSPPPGRDFSYGFSFELLRWTGGGWSYLDDVLFLPAVLVETDGDPKAEIRFLWPAFKCVAVGEHTLAAVLRSGGERGETHMVCPPWHPECATCYQKREELRSSNFRMALKSSFYVLCVRYVAPGYLGPHVPILIPHIEANGPIEEVRPGLLALRLNPAALLDMCRTIRRDQESRDTSPRR